MTAVTETQAQPRQIYDPIIDTPSCYVREGEGIHPPLDSPGYKSTQLRYPKQANACGRYLHRWDRFPAPLDPNFSGAGRCVTDDDGRYRFVTIKPGPYPWGNHYNAWRPAHIHFSLLGRAFTQRLVTQMYFPGDPLFRFDPIFNAVPDAAARERMISRFSMHGSQPDWSLAYEFDIFLRGPGATPFEEAL
jgi:protocatechuate 3,4-dioxygenase, beta subunit